MSSRNRFTAPVVLAVAAAIVPAAHADWGQANADALQDSFAAVTVDTTPSQILWQINSSINGSFPFHDLAIGAGRVYLTRDGSSSDSVTGFNLFTGAQVWQTTVVTNDLDPHLAPAVYAGNKVYLHQAGNSAINSPGPVPPPRIYAVNPRTGVSTLYVNHEGQGLEYERPIANDDYLFTGSGVYGGLGGFDTRISYMSWSKTNLLNNWAEFDYGAYPTAANNSNVYMFRTYPTGTPHGTLYGFNEKTGATTFNFNIPNATTWRDGIVLGSQNDAIVHYYDGVMHMESVSLAGAGSSRWNVQTASPPLFTAVGNGLVALGGENNTVQIYDEATGTPGWSWQVPSTPGGGGFFTQHAIMTNNQLIVSFVGSNYPSTADGTYGLNLADGSVSWFIPKFSATAVSDGLLVGVKPGFIWSYAAYRIAKNVTATLTPAVDGTQRITGGTPIVWSTDTQVQNNNVNDHAFAEFDLTAIPLQADITSATLTLDTIFYAGVVGQPIGLRVLAYDADGILDNSDLAGSMTEIGTASITSLDSLQITLDPDYIQSHLGSTSLLGLYFEGTGSLQQYGFSSVASDGIDPQLTIAYSVPEPATLSLLLIAPLFLRRQRKSA